MQNLFTKLYGYTFGAFFYYLLIVWKGITTAHPRTTDTAGVVMMVLLLLSYLFDIMIYDIGASIYFAYSVAFFIIKYRIESTILNWDVFKSSGNLYLHLLAIVAIVSCITSLFFIDFTLLELSMLFVIWTMALFYHCSNKAYK